MVGDTYIYNNNNKKGEVNYSYNYYAPKASTYNSAIDYRIGVTTIGVYNSDIIKVGN